MKRSINTNMFYEPTYSLVDKDGEQYYEFDVIQWINNKDKNKIFDILNYLFATTDCIDKKMYELKSELNPDKILRLLVEEINKKIDLSDEYIGKLIEISDNERLWNAARDFIISKDLREEFNLFCDDRFSRKTHIE